MSAILDYLSRLIQQLKSLVFHAGFGLDFGLVFRPSTPFVDVKFWKSCQSYQNGCTLAVTGYWWYLWVDIFDSR